MCCINQFVLSKDNQELVNYLIKIYFVFFKVPVCRMCVCKTVYVCSMYKYSFIQMSV